MTKPTDQIERDLQEWLESGNSDAANAPLYDKADVDAYLTLFEALKERPAAELPQDFSEIVVANLRARTDRIGDFKWNFIVALIVVFFIAITYLVISYANGEYANKLLVLLYKMKWGIVLVATCFFTIQYLDNRLLKNIYQINRWRTA